MKSKYTFSSGGWIISVLIVSIMLFVNCQSSGFLSPRYGKTHRYAKAIPGERTEVEQNKNERPNKQEVLPSPSADKASDKPVEQVAVAEENDSPVASADAKAPEAAGKYRFKLTDIFRLPQHLRTDSPVDGKKKSRSKSAEDEIGYSIAALALGVLGFILVVMSFFTLFWVLGLVGLIFGIAALVFGILGVSRSLKGMAIVGIILGGLAILLFFLALIIYMAKWASNTPEENASQSNKGACTLQGSGCCGPCCTISPGCCG